MKIKARQFLPELIYVGYTSNLNFLAKEREQAKNKLDSSAYLIPIEDS